MPRQKKTKTKIIWTGFFIRLSVLLAILLIGYAVLLTLNINKTITKITTIKNQATPLDNTPTKNTSPAITTNNAILKGSSTKRINILLLGIGGDGHKGQYLTDSIALVSINPETYQSAILSIPRDLYVQIPQSTYHTKINALYTYGIRNKNLSEKESLTFIEGAVAELTGEDVHYHIVLDFNGFEEIIDTLGGVNVQVEHDIYDSRYPGPNYSYQTFEMKKGLQTMDAATALKYARVRHTRGGDFGRAHRQQQIIASAREKALSLKVLANPFKTIKLINILGNHLKTNISPKEIPALVTLAKNVNIHQSTMKVLDAWSRDSLLKSTHVPLGGVSAYVLIPKGKNYSQIHKLSKNIFNLNKLEGFKQNIKDENIKLTLLTPTYTSFVSFKENLLQWGYKVRPYDKSDYSKYCNTQNLEIISSNTNAKLYTLNDLTERLNVKIRYTDTTKKKEGLNIKICATLDSINDFNATEEDDTLQSEKTNSSVILTESGEVIIN